RTASPGTCPGRSSPLPPSPASASTSPTPPRPSWPGACRRFARRACATRDNRRPMNVQAIDAGDVALMALDPATGEPIGHVTCAPASGVADVVEAAAKVQPLWALLRVRDRARYMRRMAQAVIDDFDELLEL